MVLHPQAQAYLERMTGYGMRPVNTMRPDEAREIDKKLTRLVVGKSERVAKIENLEIPGRGVTIPIRVYTPEGDSHPLLLYFHGGGWVFGDLDAVDSVCALLANRTKRVVVSVDYRLAPEHKFPAAVEDCYAATEWVERNAGELGGNEREIAVAGDSAGGTMAAAVSLMARDRKGPHIGYQVLVYPVVDLSEDFTRRYTDDSKSPTNTGQEMLWVKQQYFLRESDVLDQAASPMLAKELSGLPPALILTAEYDLLTDQCNAYAKRLRAAGVPAKVIHYEGMVHGFFTLPNVFDDGRRAVDTIAAELREATSTSR